MAPRIYEYVLAGLLLAVAAGGLVGYHVYHGFVTEDIGRSRAYWGIGLAFVGVATGVYIFAYGWQRGDVAKALRMSMWLGLSYPSRKSGWQFGDPDEDYEYGPSWFGATLFGDDGPPPSEPQELTVHCRNCGDLFTPQPQDARCPNCGYSAIRRAS
jgi:hypothetical protein